MKISVCRKLCSQNMCLQIQISGFVQSCIVRNNDSLNKYSSQITFMLFHNLECSLFLLKFLFLQIYLKFTLIDNTYIITYIYIYEKSYDKYKLLEFIYSNLEY